MREAHPAMAMHRKDLRQLTWSTNKGSPTPVVRFAFSRLQPGGRGTHRQHALETSVVMLQLASSAHQRRAWRVRSASQLHRTSRTFVQSGRTLMSEIGMLRQLRRRGFIQIWQESTTNTCQEFQRAAGCLEQAVSHCHAGPVPSVPIERHKSSSNRLVRLPASSRKGYHC